MQKISDGNFFSAVLGAEWRGGNVPAKIVGAAIDTRKILAGEIFVAIKTANRDGHDFLEVARERGAAGALVSRFVSGIALPQLVVPETVPALQKIAAARRRNFDENTRVVGVTGSVGKTSTKDLLARIFSAAGTTFATEKNLNNTLGVPLTLLKIDSARARFAVIEAGMSVPGELSVSAEMIFPDVALITNVCPAHLEGLGTMENIAREKASLAANPRGIAVFNANLLRYESFRKISAREVRIAIRDEDEARICAEWRASEKSCGNAVFSRVKFSECGNGFEIEIFRENFSPEKVFSSEKFFVTTASRGLAENAALAILAAEDCVPAEKIRAALAQWQPSASRGEIREISRGRKIFVDCYNASPASMADSVRAFSKRFPAGAGTPRLFVLGGMGELGAESEKLHFGVGEKIALDPATDTLALFGGNARMIGEGAAHSGFPRERIRVFDDIAALKKFVENFDGVILLKGSRAFALERAIPDENF